MNEQVRPARYEFISWDMFQTDGKKLAARLQEFRKRSGQGPWQGIVTITRGGLAPTLIVARELGIRLIDTFCLALYEDHEVNSGEVRIIKPPSKEFFDLCGKKNGQHILVLDDLVDTGQTAKMVRSMLPPCIHYATIYTKPKGALQVNTFERQVPQDTWIRFPWDTGYSFQPPIADGTVHSRKEESEVLTARGDY